MRVRKGVVVMTQARVDAAAAKRVAGGLVSWQASSVKGGR